MQVEAWKRRGFWVFCRPGGMGAGKVHKQTPRVWLVRKDLIAHMRVNKLREPYAGPWTRFDDPWRRPWSRILGWISLSDSLQLEFNWRMQHCTCAAGSNDLCETCGGDVLREAKEKAARKGIPGGR